jgi:hypothetical protein
MKDEALSLERKVFGLLVVDQGGGDTIMSASLERLLCWADPTCPVYNKGRNRFANQLEYSTIEILGGTPLEAAFCWTLACASALKGELKFGPRTFEIKSEGLKAGRLFETDSSSSYRADWANALDFDVLYYADEKDENTGKMLLPHPCCDIFLRTRNNELVLIDVYGGGSSRAANDKRSKLETFISNQQSGMTMHGVVLAPFVPPKGPSGGTSLEDNGVVELRNDTARRHLGGLAQVINNNNNNNNNNNDNDNNNDDNNNIIKDNFRLLAGSTTTSGERIVKHDASLRLKAFHATTDHRE